MPPRIRTLKPEIPQDEGLAVFSPLVRLLFIYLITQADDKGRLRGAPSFVRGACLPYDDLTIDDVDAMLEELSEAGKIVRYLVNGENYIEVTNFGSHQRIDKPTASRIPAPSRAFVEASANARRGIAEASRSDLDLEGKGKDQERINHPVALEARPSEVDLVFTTWQESTGRNRTRLDGKRKRLIRRALDSYPLAEVLAAVDGWRHSPHHRGDNDRHTVYNDLSLLLRDSEHIERFRDFTLGELQVNPGELRQKEILAALQPRLRGITDGTGEVG